jgi:hypothetical protein
MLIIAVSLQSIMLIIAVSLQSIILQIIDIIDHNERRADVAPPPYIDLPPLSSPHYQPKRHKYER